MVRYTLSFVALSFGVVALAATKYPVPPNPALGLKACAIAFDAGSPSTAKGAAGSWNVTGQGKYNYDTAWQFVKVELTLTYTKGVTSRPGPSYTVTDESTLGTPGSFSNTFNNVAAPDSANGEVLVMKAKITVQKKQGETVVVDTDSQAANVGAP